MRTTDIVEKMERGALSGSKFVSQLIETYSKRSLYLSLLEELRTFAKRKGLPKSALDFLEKRSSQGTIYVLIGETFERLNREIAIQLLNVLRDEALEQETGSQGKWKQFLNEYEKAILESYQNFLSSDGHTSVIYEVNCRLIFEASFKGWWDEAPAHLSDRKGEITRRFARELNGLFHHLRGRIATKLRFDDSLVAESLGKALIVPGLLSDLDPSILQEAIEDKGATVNLIGEVDKVIASTLREREEKEAVHILKTSAISSKEDIPKLFPRRRAEMSPEGLNALREILIGKGQELKKRASSELDESKKALSTHQKRFTEGMKGISEGLRSLTREFSSSENLLTLGEEMRERAEVLGRFLETSLWSLKQLTKREEELRKTVMSGEALTKLGPEEIGELMKKGASGGLIVRLYDTWERLQDSGGAIKELDFKAKRELKRAVREEERRCGGSEKIKILDGIVKKPLLRRSYDLDELLRRYHLVMGEVIEPLVISKKIEEMVKIWPPPVEVVSELGSSSLLREARYVGEVLALSGDLCQLCAGGDVKVDFVPSTEEPDLARTVKENCSQVVSLLVYDIRGSTFMGKKLRDAKVESEIRNKFNKRMVAVGRELGGFPVKDTGDGGIIFFSANSDELYQNCFLPRGEGDVGTIRQAVFWKGRPTISAFTRSAEKAMRCAIDMVAEAQTFVEENLSRYGDWFSKAEETTLLYQGLTYAKLPPQYKRIFKIGIGVASGSADTDLVFGLNSFGDLDVTGNLVRDANLYSKVRAEKGSIVLCDGTTVLNFLLNMEESQPRVLRETKIDGLPPVKRAAALREEVRKWWDLSQRRGEYTFSDLGAVIRRVGYRAVFGEDLEGEEPLTVEAKGVRIDEYGKMRDEKGREVKVLYEVIPEERSQMGVRT